MSGAGAAGSGGPSHWLWGALLLGAALRAYLVGWTEGSFDVSIKLHHGVSVNEHGLLGYYARAEVFNHPPLMGRFFAWAAGLAESTGWAFPVLLRAPFAALDLATALLLRLAFRDSPHRDAVFAAYWLHPLALVFSAYHGNTDSALACFALASLVLAAGGRAAAAGAALGLGLWVKLPILLAAPALALGLGSWRDRALFSAAAAGVALVGYLPTLWQEPGLLLERIALYGGSGVVTPRGLAVWGWAVALGLDGSAFAAGAERWNALVVGLPVLALAWLRRGRGSAAELGVTVCGSFLLVYGLSSFWAWQYLAWSVAFWFFLGWRFTAVATLVLGAYVYGAYVLFTGSPWLVGRWNFMAHASFPVWLEWLRDASVVLCLVAGSVVLGRAVRERVGEPA